MQTKNGTERRTETYERLNRSRVKRSQRPYFTHEVVTMRLSRPERGGSKNGGGGDGDSKRLHRCKGHFKLREIYPRDPEGRILSPEKVPSLVWWVPHLRGDARKGMVLPKHVRVRL